MKLIYPKTNLPKLALPKNIEFDLNFSLHLISLMFFLCVVNPLHLAPLAGFFNEWLAATLGLFAMLPLLRKKYWQTIFIPQIALIFPTLALILSLQWILGMLQSPQYALLVLSYFTWAFCLTILGYYLNRELGIEKIVSSLSKDLIIAGLMNILFVSVQYYEAINRAIPFSHHISYLGSAGQNNHFCDFMALASASLIYHYAKLRISSVWFTTILSLFLIMLAVSGSRSSWLYLTAFVILAFVLYFMTKKRGEDTQKSRKIILISLLMLPALALINLIIHFLGFDAIFTLSTSRIVDSIHAVNAMYTRSIIWKSSWDVFLEAPLLGVGFGQISWQVFLQKGIPDVLQATYTFEHAHNLFLQLATEMGIVGPIVVLTSILLWIKNYKWRALSLESWWLLAILSVIGIHSMFEYPLWYTFFLGIAVVLLGIGEEKVVNFKPSNFALQSIYVTFIGLLLIGIVNLVTLMIANIKLSQWAIRTNESRIELKDQPKLFKDLNWVHNYSLLSPYAELIYAPLLTINPNLLDAKLWLSESAMHVWPLEKIVYQHVILLKLKGDQTGAVALLKRCLMVYPKYNNRIIESLPLEYKASYLEVLKEALSSKSKIKTSNELARKDFSNKWEIFSSAAIAAPTSKNPIVKITPSPKKSAKLSSSNKKEISEPLDFFISDIKKFLHW